MGISIALLASSAPVASYYFYVEDREVLRDLMLVSYLSTAGLTASLIAIIGGLV